MTTPFGGVYKTLLSVKKLSFSLSAVCKVSLGKNVNRSISHGVWCGGVEKKL